MNRRNASQRGMLLIPIAFMVLVMAGLAMALLIEVDGERRSIHHHETSFHALQTAEAGLVRAELEIFALQDSGTDGIGTVSGALGRGTYAVSAQQSATSPNRWTLIARGDRELSMRRIEVGVRRRANGEFVEGMFSRDQLEVNGGLRTDSFDSRMGTYASQAINVDLHGVYGRRRGHLGSNNNIVLNGGTIAVRGNAIPGVLRQTLTSGSPTIVGDTLPRTDPVTVADPTYDEFLAAHDTNDNATGIASSGGGGGGGGPGGPGGGGPKPKSHYDATKMTLSVTNGDTVTLDPGTYFFSDVVISGTSQLKITGQTTIYVTGKFDLGGQGLTNVPGTASNLRVVAHKYPLPASNPPSAADSVTLHGGPTFIGTVYAPAVPLTLDGGTDFYGAVIAGDISLNGAVDFHYDEALGDFGERGTVLLERLYWREVMLPAR